MKIKSKFSKSFYSENLNTEKYDTLLAHAKKINQIKNEISKIISADILFYLEKSKFDLIKQFNKAYSGQLPAADLECLIADVHHAYQNKFEAIKTKIEFKQVQSIEQELYKRNTKFNKKGDLKKINVKYISTNLSKTLTYLARYGFEDTENYIKNKINSVEPKQQKVYQNILNNIQKFGFKRLFNLALSKRTRILNQYNTPIEFKKLSFRSRNRINDNILNYNKNFNSEIDCFITLGNIEEYKKLHIPVKYSKSYHKEVKRYAKGLNSSYTVCFTDDPNSVRIILSYEDERVIPDNKFEYIGVDVNMKTNMFSTSERFTVDYDRELLNKYAEELIKLDELKKNKEYEIGKKREKKINSLKDKVEDDTERKIVELIKISKSLGKDHLILENLTGFNTKTYGKDGVTELKISRLTRELKLSSMKDKVESISRKYNVSVSLVQSHYSSQECPKCHCIDSENRISQEIFKCIKCGHEDGADFVSPVNLVNRVTSNVLKDSLLKEKYVNSNIFEPKVLVKEKIKDILLTQGY